MLAGRWGSPSNLGADGEWYLLFELLGRVVVDQGHREGDSVVVTHQREQHPRVGGGADPSHDLYFPGCFRPNVRRCSCCNEGGASRGHTDTGEMGVSREHPQQPQPCLALQEQVGSRQRAQCWALKKPSLSEPTALSCEVTGQLGHLIHSKGTRATEDSCFLPGQPVPWSPEHP